MSYFRKAAALWTAMLTVASLAGTNAFADSDPALIEAAQKEGTVTWASGLIVNQAVRPMAAAFEKKYGIKVETTTVENLLLRMTSEARAGTPTIDLFDNSGNTIPAMRAADLVVPYVSPEAARYRPEHKDPDHYWVSCGLFYYALAVNTNLVKPHDEPKSYADLLDPKWKGRMVWQDSGNYGEPPLFVGVRLMSMGEEAGMTYLEALAEQDITRIPGNARKVLDKVILGQYAMSVMALNHHVVISAEQGAPVKWLKLGPVPGITNVVALVKDAPHPNAAKLLYDFILSEDGQNVLKEAYYLPADPNVPAKVPELKPEHGDFTAIVIPPSANDDAHAKWVEIYRRLFVER